jgi:hypothetical protein
MHPNPNSRALVISSLSLYLSLSHTHTLSLSLSHQCELAPGDVLFIPALWFHNVHAVDFCASANFFWHAEPEALYDADDVFGNKDLVGAQRALGAAHACRAALRCDAQLIRMGEGCHHGHGSE